MRKQPRNRVNGKYKHSGWYNFKKKKRSLSEYAWHPISISVLALTGYVGTQIYPIYEHISHASDMVEILREPAGIPAHAAKTSGDTGETEPFAGTPKTEPRRPALEEESVSDSATEDEGQEPSQVHPPSSIEAKILKAWEGTNDGHIAVAIAKGESKLRPDAVGDRHIEFWSGGKKMGHSCGIFQVRVLPGRPDCETLKDVDKNIEYARKLYDRAGFQPWTVFTKGIYLKYL